MRHRRSALRPMPRNRGSGKPNKVASGLLLAMLGFGIIGAMSDKDKSSTYVPQTTEPMSPMSPPSLETKSVSGTRAVTAVTLSEDPAPAVSVSQDVTRYVRGRKVALRDGPGKQFGILDRYDSGREVSVSEQNSGWSKVRDKLTAKEGWVLASLLSEMKSDGNDNVPAKRGNDEPSHDGGDKKPEPHVPQIPESAVVQRIIAQSLSMYPGSCACPYNVDRGGRRCGKRSAYNRGGGYAPICFAGDVSKEMIQSFREQARND